MAIITWKNVYETGIVAFDKEHQELVTQINRLYEAVRNKQSDDVLVETLTMLEGYTEDHFQHEEKVMAEYGYPGLADHQRVHQELRDAVQELKGRESSSAQELAQELLKFLRVWVLEHIIEVDKKYGSFLESRGGRFVS